MQETALIVNEGVTIGGKSMREHLEAINHAEAIDYIKEVAKGEIPISEAVIRDIHAIVLHSIDRENAGRYRTVPVMISGSRFTPPQPYLIAPQMEQFIRTYEQMETQRTHPVLVAAYLHNELVRIHPFIDGNGRTSRLLMNLYLLRKGYPIVSLKSDNDSKLRYYMSLEKSHMESDPVDFDLFVASAVLDTLGRYMELIMKNGDLSLKVATR